MQNISKVLSVTIIMFWNGEISWRYSSAYKSAAWSTVGISESRKI